MKITLFGLLFAVFLVLASPSPSSAVFVDDFNSLDAWGTATGVESYLGPPTWVNFWWFSDGQRTEWCLYIQNDISSDQGRRGYGTKETFNYSNARVSVDFMPVGGNAGVFELWLTSPNNKDIWVGIYKDAQGNASVRTGSSQTTTLFSLDTSLWYPGAWYGLVIDAGSSDTHVSFRNATGSEIWGYSYNFGMGTMENSFYVNLIQANGLSVTPKAAINRVTVEEVSPPSPVPLPATLLLLAPGLVAIAAMKRRSNKRPSMILHESI